MSKICTTVLLFLSLSGGLMPLASSLAQAESTVEFTHSITAPSKPIEVQKNCGEILLNLQRANRSQNDTKIQDRDLLMSAISLAGGMNAEHLSGSMLNALREVGRVEGISELNDPNVLRRIQQTLKHRMKPEEFEETVGSGLASARSTLVAQNKPFRSAWRDSTDMHRGWGWKLLPDDDPAFNDPRYLAQLARESGVGGRVLNLQKSQAWTDPWDKFVEAWRKIAPPNVDPRSIQFALTGTDANNMLYYMASRADAKRRSSNGSNLREVEILAFDGAYGGGSGRIGRVGLFNKDPSTKQLRVVSPDTPVWKPTDPAEIQRLKVIEDQALQEIEAKVTQGNPPIGGLLIESMLGAGGVRFYRTEFLQKVRALCDRLQIPIFADEVLTGGGRTGKFFAYQHYDGFEPDFITFGKGLQVAGVAQTDRGRQHWGNMPYRSVTLRHYNEPLLKSAQVMNRIREGGLMDNAQQVGAYIVANLRAQSPNSASASEIQNAEIARGMGMLIYSQSEIPGVRDARGRLMPVLTLTQEDVDQILGPSIPGLDLAQRKVNYQKSVGVPVKLGDGTIIEGSVSHGGIQPHYVINLQAPAMEDFLRGAKEIGKTDLPFWSKVAQIASYTRQALINGWAYNSPVYIQLLESFRNAGKNIPLHSYLENSCGVCREQAMILHLALEAAGFDSTYLYVRSYESGVYIEDHGIALVKYQGEDWIVDSRNQENTGRRLTDVTRPGGIQSTDPVAPMNLPPYRFDPSETRFEPTPYPQIWIPLIRR